MKIILTLILIGITGISISQQSDDWEWQNPKPQGNNIYDIMFINDNIGYAAGKFGTFLKTTDGGMNWEFKNSQTLVDLSSIYFLNPDTGYVSGLSGYIAKTTKKNIIN